VDPQKLEDTLAAHPDARFVAFVHAETSTGAQSDARTLAELARRHDCLTIVDTRDIAGRDTRRGGCLGIDAVYSGTQKCLSCVPGIAPVTFSERAREHIANRSHKVQSWFLDMSLVMGYWGGGARRAYHHTAPVNAMYALHEALSMVHEEGLENAWTRHRRNHLALKAGLEAMGLRFIVDEAHRLPQLNAVEIPEGVDDAAVRRRLLEEHHLEIGAGLGDLAGRVWRIGLMGYSSRIENITRCLGALDAVLADIGAPVEHGVALPAAEKILSAEAA
jgi:alanine-glyoxylate transaminase / serine-glyoxylate transaminase / serine-pyruvate transaminase